MLEERPHVVDGITVMDGDPKLHLHCVLILSKLCMKAGITWPSQVGLSVAVVVECWHWPVAVAMVMDGVMWFMLMIGVAGMK